jgi:hypothetical protein
VLRRVSFIAVCLTLLALGVLASASAAPATAGAAAAGASAGRLVRVTFTGKGGGRYLDVTRWLRDDTRECYARRRADETVAVSWRYVWTARLVETKRGSQLVGVARKGAAAAGHVHGISVRDSCDAAEEEEPGWAGSDRCDGPLPVASSGRLSTRASGSGIDLALGGPVYGGPAHPCELEIRNDQLAAHFFLSAAMAAELDSGHGVAAPVGTAHPRPGDSFQATKNCSAFPHVYEGVVYLYDCDDTLTWSGRLSISPA